MSYASHGECLSVGVKARVLYSRLLSDEDYWSLLGSDSVGEVAAKLRSTEAYGESTSRLPQDVHRYDLEFAVRMTLPEIANKFIIHLSSPRDSFLRAWLSLYEAENLKSIFRYIASDRTDRDGLRRRLYAVPGSPVSYENLLSARDFSAASDALRGTPYWRALSEPLRRLAGGMPESLFNLETAVDSFVERLLMRALERLEPAERARLLPLFGARADLLNVDILYRSLAFYAMTPEETLGALLPGRWRITLPRLREAARMRSEDAVTQMLTAHYPAYSELLAVSEGEDPHMAFERNVKRRIIKSALAVYRSSSPGFHTAMAYFVIKSFETEDLVHIVEDVRYDYDRRTAARYLTKDIITGGDSEWQ